ncbi:MAG: CarD family transcriptional regulator [Clostridia bacterium]|nr:CarD family transcriptional regulator [Clostridia bacterium]
MFSIGDTVCYPLHGVGKIESIEEQRVLDRTAVYYVIRLANTRMTASIPVDNAEAVGLRNIISASECSELKTYYKTARPEIGDSNWNQRYRDNMEKLRKGDPHSVIDVILCLTKRNTMRTLSSGERKMLSNARSILASEIAAATGREQSEVEKSFFA